MSDRDLFDAVAHVTGEDSHEMGTVDWDAVLGDGGFGTPF